MRTLARVFSLVLSPLYITLAIADLYQWTDVHGVLHIVDEAAEVPDEYSEELTVYSAAKGEDLPRFAEPAALQLAPSRTYAHNSQGAFAQRLAVHLGLIKSQKEDALGPLNGAGIGPAGGWKVSDLLSHEALAEISAAVRRAARSQRVTLSANEAVAAVNRVARPYLPVPEVVHALTRPEVVVIQQPPQIMEVIHEQYHVQAPYEYGSGRRFPHRRRIRDQILGGVSGGEEGTLVLPSEPRRTPARSAFPSLNRSPVGGSPLPMGTSRLPLGLNSMARATIR